MPTNYPRSDVTNTQVAKDLGGILSHASISRIRSGTRTPTYATLWAMHKVYHWPIYDQVLAIVEDKDYAEQFERRLDLHYFGSEAAADEDEV